MPGTRHTHTHTYYSAGSRIRILPATSQLTYFPVVLLIDIEQDSQQDLVRSLSCHSQALALLSWAHPARFCHPTCEAVFEICPQFQHPKKCHSWHEGLRLLRVATGPLFKLKASHFPLNSSLCGDISSESCFKTSHFTTISLRTATVSVRIYRVCDEWRPSSMSPLCGRKVLHVATLALSWAAELILFFLSERKFQISGRGVAVGVPIPSSLIFFLYAKPCCQPPRTIKDACRRHWDNDQIMCNMEQWAKEQK